MFPELRRHDRDEEAKIVLSSSCTSAVIEEVRDTQNRRSLEEHGQSQAA